MNRIFSFSLVGSFLLVLLAASFQAKKTNSSYELSSELNELSGLTFLNDSLLLAHNDGGNSNTLFILNLNGKIIHKVHVLGEKQSDWEDITMDSDRKFMYIGDIGNNRNDRTSCNILKINAENILLKNEVIAEKISFTYPEQTEFPATKKQRNFDAEGLAFYNDSLRIFTKCRTKPFTGLSYVYSLSTEVKTQEARKTDSLKLGKKGMLFDAVTAAEIVGNKCYLLTYNRIFTYEICENKLKLLHKTKLKPYTQKEALTVRNDGFAAVGDEKHPKLGGGKIYIKTLK